MVTMRATDAINDFIRQMNKQSTVFLEKKLADLIYIAQVEDVQYDDTLALNFVKVTKLHNGESVDYVKIGGIGLGNYSGLIKVPRINDFGLVIEVNGEPFWVTNVLDIYTANPDKLPDIREAFILQNKEAGSFQIFTKNDNVAITTQDGGKIIFLKGGGFKLFDKNNYGIESDGDGNVTIRGQTVNHTQTAGEFKIE